MPYLIENLEIADNPVVLFRGIVGSRAYGTQNANGALHARRQQEAVRHAEGCG